MRYMTHLVDFGYQKSNTLMCQRGNSLVFTQQWTPTLFLEFADLSSLFCFLQGFYKNMNQNLKAQNACPVILLSISKYKQTQTIRWEFLLYFNILKLCRRRLWEEKRELAITMHGILLEQDNVMTIAMMRSFIVLDNYCLYYSRFCFIFHIYINLLLFFFSISLQYFNFLFLS